MNVLCGDVDCRSSGSATVKTSRVRPLLCRSSDDAEPRLPVIRQCNGSGTTVLRPCSTHARQCCRRDAAAVSCGNLPNLYLAYLSVVTRAQAVLQWSSRPEQPPTAIPRTKHGQAQNCPIITTYDHVQQILLLFGLD